MWRAFQLRLVQFFSAAGLLAVSFFAQGADPGELLSLPERPATVPAGRAFAAEIGGLDLRAREQRIVDQILSGNIPTFLRQLRQVRMTNATDSATNRATLSVAPDYLALGSDQDYLYVPLSPAAAQTVADALGCLLPTRKIVDAIHRAAPLKLNPSPILPSAAMTTVPVFLEHSLMVQSQRLTSAAAFPLGELVAGGKKDIVITPRLTEAPGKVAIYGWHRPDGTVIQPLYSGHAGTWVDYSHGVRLVSRKVTINGLPRDLGDVFSDDQLSRLVSDEGPLNYSRYPTNTASAGQDGVFAAQSRPAEAPLFFSGFRTNRQFGEMMATLRLEPGVEIEINAPASATGGKGEVLLEKQATLIFYGLPNGNTIAWTKGKKRTPQEDWHFDIQHIAAQTRFLRQLFPGRTLVVAYLEAEGKSWPAWRRKHENAKIPELLGRVRQFVSAPSVEIVLNGHSGGGSLIFGYLNAVESVPQEVRRICFLDSNYAYDTAAGHAPKLANWLKANPGHGLVVLAYNDAVALLNGTNFVSAAGGTWGRSLAMKRDLSEYFGFSSRTNGDLETYTALDGRIEFDLLQNPERKILHTVQVERNGFIHSMLVGTPLVNRGYEYFGDRAYSGWIDSE